MRLQLDRAEYLNKVYTDKFQELDERLRQLEKRDNEVYRTVFEAQPLPDSLRVRQLEKRREMQLLAGMDSEELTEGITKKLSSIYNRIISQEKSYKQIETMVKNKEKLLASTPAIQPVSNKDLDRLSSGFGYRIDPLYKTVKFHAGLDFTSTHRNAGLCNCRRCR